MWADFIVEANVLVYALPEMPFRCIFSAVGFFLFEGRKESFRHSVVMRTGSCGKGLFDTKLFVIYCVSTVFINGEKTAY